MCVCLCMVYTIMCPSRCIHELPPTDLFHSLREKACADDSFSLPPLLWQLTANMSVVDSARAFAVVSSAVADARVAAWDSKFYYNHWRPITAIRAGNGCVVHSLLACKRLHTGHDRVSWMILD